MDKSRLALGTVQFGLPYGVANSGGQVGLEEAAAIVAAARTVGIDTLDTAIAYGDSEARLGQIGVPGWCVVTKLPAVPESCPDVSAWVKTAVDGSLERLKIGRLHGLLVHRSDQLLGTQGEALSKALAQIKAQGLVEKIGVSIYGPEELDALWPRHPLDLVQAPFNIFDRRMAETGWFTKLHAAGIEIHARSAFLQGLLMMKPSERPAYFGRWPMLWACWQAWLQECGQTPLEACLRFALSAAEVSRVVVGVESRSQLQEIIAAASRGPGAAPSEHLICDDLDLIDPSHWPTESWKTAKA